MSATKPDFHLNINDGLKKIRQKIGKSFCEPGNLDKNVALELCKKIVFPFADYLKWREKYIVGGDEFKGFFNLIKNKGVLTRDRPEGSVGIFSINIDFLHFYLIQCAKFV